MILTEKHCKEIFQKAYQKRYTWNTHFSGYYLNNHKYNKETD